MSAVNVSLVSPFLQIFHNRGHKSLGAGRVTTVWRLTRHLGNSTSSGCLTALILDALLPPRQEVALATNPLTFTRDDLLAL